METIDIVATIGPSSMNYGTLKNMVSSGMTIARINTKYGVPQQWTQILINLRKINRTKILFDLKGTKAIKWLKTQKFDFIAISFCETTKQINNIRKLFKPFNVKIIAKIETEKGVKNIDEIIKASDGLMVARGDLGNHVPLPKLPLYQKYLIKKCTMMKRFVITATEMLLSMTHSKLPTRAEVSDVANAVLDGSDALMLSEETAIGKYPVEAVKMMRKIIKATEKGRNSCP